MKISSWASGVMRVTMFGAAFAIPGTGIAMAPQTTAVASVAGSSGLLPATGADLAAMVVAGLGAIAAGAISMAAIRHRGAGRD